MNNPAKKKFCFVIHSLGPGGMERVMSELLNYFTRKSEAELHLVLYGKGRKKFYSIPEDVKVHEPAWEFDNTKRILFTFKTIIYLRKKIKEINPDSVLSFGELWNNFVLLSLLGSGYKVYVSDRCRPDKQLSPIQELIRKVLYPGAAGVIAQTHRAGKIYAEKKLNKNIKVIGNPIRQIKNKQKESVREDIVLSVGRLIKTKHHDRLIKIFKECKKQNWKLVIVGGDAQKQNNMVNLQKLKHSLGMNDNVILTGNVKDVEYYYNKSKIFAFTSSSEGFPNVIGEAMSAGLPIIAYDCIAGPSEMVKNGVNGYLIRQFDDHDFKEKLTKLIENENLRKQMGSMSKRVIVKYSVDSIGKQFYSYISEGK